MPKKDTYRWFEIHSSAGRFDIQFGSAASARLSGGCRSNNLFHNIHDTVKEHHDANGISLDYLVERPQTVPIVHQLHDKNAIGDLSQTQPHRTYQTPLYGSHDAKTKPQLEGKISDALEYFRSAWSHIFL